MFPLFFKKMRNSLFPLCKNLIGNNFNSIKNKAVNLRVTGVFEYGGLNGVTVNFVT